jgi:hypothetical protein
MGVNPAQPRFALSQGRLPLPLYEGRLTDILLLASKLLAQPTLRAIGLSRGLIIKTYGNCTRSY